MNRLILLSGAIIAITPLPAISAAEATPPTPFVHPGLLQNRQDLDYLKAQVHSGAGPWKDAVDRMLKPQPARKGAPAGTILEFTAKPFTHVIRGAYGKPTIGSAELQVSADTAYNAAMLWYLTGEKAYAAKAIEIIDAWSARLWDFEDNDAKLLAAWTGHVWCNAAEIVRYSNAGWSEKAEQQFERMLRDVYYPLLADFESDSNGNWDAAIIDTMAAMGVYLDDHAIFDRAIQRYRRGPGNGGITKYIYPSGQCQETTRDAGHVQLGLGEFAQAAQIAWTQGVDVFGDADSRLARGLEYAAKYNLGAPIPIKGVPSTAGKFSDVYQGAYHHYHRVKGFELPFMAKAVAATETNSTIRLLNGTRAPAQAPTTSRFLPANQVAPDAGAGDEPSSAPAPGSIEIAPGTSIQVALDAHAGSGAWIVLGKGVYQLEAALKIPSGITLAGQGRDTILFLDPKLTEEMFSPAGLVMENAGPDLHDVTIRDLVIEGGVTTKRGTTNDPNQDRRARSYQMAPSRAGVAFLAEFERQMQRIRFDHVTVRNCTHNGVAIRGAMGVTITHCDFSDSGGSVMPGARWEHNLVLTHATDVEISESQFDTSPWGNGIELLFCRKVTVAKNEIARNALNGIHLADSDTVTLSDNLIEGNDSAGIAVETLMDNDRNVRIHSNLIQYNGRKAIQLTAREKLDLQTNRLIENGEDQEPGID